MQNVVDKLLANVTADQLMEVIVRVTRSAPEAVLEAFDHVLDGELVTITWDGATAQIPKTAYADVEAFCTGGKKVAGIKELRHHTGWGLKETKDFVESVWNC